MVVSLLVPLSCFFICFFQKPGMDVADAYVTFVRHSQDILRDKVNEEIYIERLFDVSKCLLLLPKEETIQNMTKQMDRGISHILRLIYHCPIPLTKTSLCRSLF